ncbi:hypothetical protein A2U01_0050649, partial [Trifolium medium]|nr:hypothetical protein [Trifolium medium]
MARNRRKFFRGYKTAGNLGRSFLLAVLLV